MAKSKEKENKDDKSKLFVVGVGASAGGLDALTKLLSSFETISADFCVVIVMHLSPDYKSELASILSKRCKWDVVTAENDKKLKAGTVYATPQNKNIFIENDTIKLEPLPPEHRNAPSIDVFFDSLSKQKKRNAIAIILSGYGKDGSEGLKTIKENNGLTMVQLPESAEHKDMPQSALNTDKVDVSIPAEQMFDEILNYVRNSNTIAKHPPKKKNIDALFELLEKRSGTDFSMYKPATIMRRINHRINSLSLTSLVDYYELIKNHPRELDILFETVLIGVTEFFRDAASFDHLKKQVSEILKDKSPGDSIRVWSVGCATGEEPYSISILLHEILGVDIRQYHLQIFASDLDEKALNFGRKGVYGKDSLKNLPKKIVEKYFNPVNGSYYEIKKKIKQHTLFTRHDISKDPPFVKLDLVVCRNLLIYFSNDLQKQTLQIFHYALKPTGILFLGKSETISIAADLFQKTKHPKIFKKAEATLGYQLKFSRLSATNHLQSQKKEQKETKHMSIVDVAKETLYYKYEHPFVIINEQSEIKEVHGSLRLYLEISQGAMNANLHKMVNPELTNVIKALHAQVKRTGVPHKSHMVKFRLYDTNHYVKVNVIPLIFTLSEMQYYMVIFEKIEPSDKMLELQKKLSTTDFENLRIKELEEELAASQEHLQIFTEELEATNEELQTINEELQSSNEELKSSNEELETSNEELQSSNEELNTANNELRLTNDALVEKEEELQKANEKSERNRRIYQSIAEHIPNGTVGIVDKQYNIEYVAGIGLKRLGMNPEDLIGKNFLDLNPSNEERKKIRKVFDQTLENKPAHDEIHYYERSFDLQTVPIITPGSDDLKIMYLSQDITERIKSEVKLKTAIKAASLVMYEYNYKTDTYVTTPPLRELFGFDKAVKITRKLFLNQFHKDDVERIFQKKSEAVETGTLAYEARVNNPVNPKWIRGFGKIMYDEHKQPELAIATIVDITNDKKLLHQVKEQEQRFRKLTDSAPVIIWQTDENRRCNYFNKQWYDTIGGKPKDHLGFGWADSIHPEDRERVMKAYNDAYEKVKFYNVECRLRLKDNSYKWFLVFAHPILDYRDKLDGFIGVCVDINIQKIFSQALEKKVSERTAELNESNAELVKANIHLEEYAYVASHDLQEPLRKIRIFNSMLEEHRKEPKVHSEYVNKIESSAANMAKLIKDILDYSKLYDTQINFENISLDDLVNDIIGDLEIIIEDKNAKVKLGKLGSINGIHLHLYQLFLNLIKNAIKFNDSEIPIVEITTEKVKPGNMPKTYDSDPNQEYCLIKFKDNGIGIDINQKETIFKPFKQLQSKTSYPGTGIGLAICSRIVTMHKGFIDVENNRRKYGVTFKVYLPIV